MRPPFDSVAELTSAYADANILLAELVPDDRGSLRRLAAPSSLPPLATLAGMEDAEIVLHAALSQGGMGQVFTAEQRSVGRDVAVKIASKGVLGTIARSELVVEGRITGRLEHPNIVPVHMLGTSADGSPLIVMQRIEGEAWSDVLARGPSLRRDVDVLVSVCRALRFAHERGVIHRDVKPSNVMLGRFGEVFLLDWGIAVGAGDRAPPELLPAAAIADVAGTPQYMAPEMVTPPTSVDARTDIYLVGATLYEIVTGRAPHAREDLAESLFAAQQAAPPSFHDDVPAELVAICTRAMAREPSARFHDVDELQAALELFQRHAEARELCARAETRGAALERNDDENDSEVQRAFLESRFAFAQALKSWPDSPRARTGLARVIAQMARREIAKGRYDAAVLVALELDPAEMELNRCLNDELGALKARLDDEALSAVQLARYAHENDNRTAERERALILLAASVGFLMMMCGFTLLAARGIFVAGPGTFAVGISVLSAVFVVAGVLVPKLRATAASRQIFVVMCASEGGLAAAYAVGWRFALSVATTLALVHCCMALFAAAFATRDSRMWRGAMMAVLVAPAIAIAPQYAYVTSGVGTLVAVLAGSWHLWFTPPPSRGSRARP